MSIIAKRPIMGENEWEDMAFKAISALHKEHNKEGRAAATLPSCEGGAGAAPQAQAVHPGLSDADAEHLEGAGGAGI